MSLLWLGGVKRLVFTTDAMWTGEGELVLNMIRSSSTCCNAWTGAGAGLWLGSGANLRSPGWTEPWKVVDDPWVMQAASSLRSIPAVRRSICWTTWMTMNRVGTRPNCRNYWLYNKIPYWHIFIWFHIIFHWRSEGNILHFTQVRVSDKKGKKQNHQRDTASLNYSNG